MRKLSAWAKHHPRTARIIIILSHILLLSLAWYTGSSLGLLKIFLPGYLLFVFILLYLIIVFIYPSKEEKQFLNKRSFYLRQKFCDFNLAFAAYGMVICLANAEQKGLVSPPLYAITSSVIKEDHKPTAAEILASLEYRNKSTLTKQEKRILKKEFYIQLKKYTVAKIDGNKEKQGDAGLIILAIVAALGLLYLLGALACTLSCNGSDAAAIIVGILGLAGIIIGLIAVIKAIKRKSKTKKES